MSVPTQNTPTSSGAPLGVAWIIVVGSIVLLWLLGGFLFRSVSA